MENKYINLVPEGKTPIYHASQGDDGRVVRSTLFDEAAAYTLDGSEKLRLRYTKPNGEFSSIAVANTGENYVDITIPATMTDITGLVYCKLRVNGIGAKAFFINIEREV